MVYTTPALRRAISSARRVEEYTQDAEASSPAVDTYAEPMKERDHHPLDAEHDEMPLPVGQRDWTFWAALCLLVGPVYAVVPLSWAYTLYTGRRIYLQESLRYWELALFGYTLFEVSDLRSAIATLLKPCLAIDAVLNILPGATQLCTHDQEPRRYSRSP